MTTTTQLVGKPIAVDYLPTRPKSIHPIQIVIDCGNYKQTVVIDFRSEADAAHALMMWEELIFTAEKYQAE